MKRALLRRQRLRALVAHEFPTITPQTVDTFVEVLFRSTIPLAQEGAYHVVQRLTARLVARERTHLLRVLSATYHDRWRGGEGDIATDEDWDSWLRNMGPE